MASNPLEAILSIPGKILGMATGAGAVEDAQEALQQQYQQNLQMLQAYRPKALEAREMGLAHTLGAYNPANEYLKRMYGEDMGLDLQALGDPGIADFLGSPDSLPSPGPSGGRPLEPGDPFYNSLSGYNPKRDRDLLVPGDPFYGSLGGTGGPVKRSQSIPGKGSPGEPFGVSLGTPGKALRARKAYGL